MAASGEMNSNTALNKINETRCNNNVEVGDLSANEGNIYRQTRTHHKSDRCTEKLQRHRM